MDNEGLERIPYYSPACDFNFRSLSVEFTLNKFYDFVKVSILAASKDIKGRETTFGPSMNSQMGFG